MITATIFEAKTNLSELIKKVQSGETVMITSGREKTPIARLEPIPPKAPPQRLGLLYDPNLKLPDNYMDQFWEPLDQEELRLWNEGDDNDPLYTGLPR